jgi:alkylation response protein AidB-like acyl-CoA dehydrogenase
LLENDFLCTNIEKDIRSEVKEFVNTIDPELIRKMDKNEIDYPFEFIREAGRRNLLGLRFSEKYGGRALPWTAECIALEEIGVLGMGLGCSYAMPSIVGEALSKFGKEWQREEFLKPVIKGEKLSAEGLTEPRGGSDFFGTTTTAEKKGNKWVLNGMKRFIAGGKVADFYLIYARTDKNAPGHKALSLFIVERDMGVEVEELFNLLGFKGMGTARIVFKNLEVPDENMVGNLNDGGKIFNHMMVPERLTSAAGAIGTARVALELAMKYSDRRKAFGSKIREFQGVNFKVANCLSKLDAARGLVYMAAKAADASEKDPMVDPRRLVSEAKQFATDTGWEIVNDAMQIIGGIGYTQVYPIERLLRDMRLAPIWTGSNEIMKMLVQHEAYKMLGLPIKDRDIEKDALDWYKDSEKVFE